MAEMTHEKAETLLLSERRAFRESTDLAIARKLGRSGLSGAVFFTTLIVVSAFSLSRSHREDGWWFYVMVTHGPMLCFVIHFYRRFLQFGRVSKLLADAGLQDLAGLKAPNRSPDGTDPSFSP